ncbi:hypothetical protein NDU88_001812 [Pleurodeles waltl]|uniref:Uncharacterized protein n=1 Tax=Pleurodeles waltl TaxID=8319 RepID=A0AAV7KUD4_PLEWA|nr:hypothetical protein NDU88_001812 [Pleurodeles waltl]
MSRQVPLKWRQWQGPAKDPRSRVVDSPATFSAGSRSERHPGGPEENGAIEDGNPDIRIPINLPIEGREARSVEKGKAAGAGNPDIRVPESFKREEGLSTGRTGEEKDAEEKTAESADRENSGENEKTSDPHLGEEGPVNTRENPTEGQDGPEKLKLRHVPGGTWLKQKDGKREAWRRAKPPEPGTRISEFPGVSKEKKDCAQGAQERKRMPKRKQRRVRTVKTAEKTRKPATHTLGKKDQLTP